MAQKKTAEADVKKAETRALGDQIAGLDRTSAQAEEQRDALLLQLPNLPHEKSEDRPVGGG